MIGNPISDLEAVIGDRSHNLEGLLTPFRKITLPGMFFEALSLVLQMGFRSSLSKGWKILTVNSTSPYNINILCRLGSSRLVICSNNTRATFGPSEVLQLLHDVLCSH